MYMMVLPSTCPACKAQVDSLTYWLKTRHGIYFHLCKDCVGKELTQEQLLEVGYQKGVESTVESTIEFVKDVLRDPRLKESHEKE